MDRSILDKMLLTPAEWQVVYEQAQGIITASQDLLRAAESRDLKDIAYLYTVIDGHRDYMGDLLNAKAGVAARELFKEQQG